MLDEMIAARTASQDHNRRVALAIQRLARVVVIPAAAIMFGGLIAFEARGGVTGDLLEHAVIPLRSIFSRATVSPLGAMSVGLLALALLPMANVVYILVDSLLHRRWSDAGAAAAVATILIIGILLGHA